MHLQLKIVSLSGWVSHANKYKHAHTHPYIRTHKPTHADSPGWYVKGLGNLTPLQSKIKNKTATEEQVHLEAKSVQIILSLASDKKQ